MNKFQVWGLERVYIRVALSFIPRSQVVIPNDLSPPPPPSQPVGESELLGRARAYCGEGQQAGDSGHRVRTTLRRQVEAKSVRCV
jgi:hypothetical protein